MVEGMQPGESLRSVDSMGSIRSQSSTRRRKRKGKKRKSLTAVFSDGNPTAVDSVMEEAPSETISQPITSEFLNTKVVPGEAESEELKLEDSVREFAEQKEYEKGLVVDVVAGEGGPAVELELARQGEVEVDVVGCGVGPAVELELAKQDEVEVGAMLDVNDSITIDVNMGAEDSLLVEASRAEEISPTEDIMDNGTTTSAAVLAPTDRQDGKIASDVQPPTPKNRLRRLMGKAIKHHPRNEVDGQSVEALPTETPQLSPLTPVNPELSPSSTETKLPRLSRKPRVPKLAKLSDELSLWMKADKKINDPASIPTRYSQSMPSLIPSVSSSSSRIPMPGGSRRQVTEYTSSGQESPIESFTDAAPSPTTLTYSQFPRLQRVMTEPAVQKHELPMRHYPATTDDIPSYESRIPRRPSQTIRLVDPDPEDVAALQTSKLQSKQQSSNRFGFRRTASQSSLTASQDSVDESRPPQSPLPTPSGTKLVSDSTPTLAHVSNTSPSGSTVSLGLFRSKTWGFDKDKGKDKGKEKKEKREKEKREKKVIPRY